MKEQAAEIKKLDGRVKILATQLQGTLSKLSAPTAVGKTSDNHAKQLEHASNRVAEVTKEFNDKKKEVIMAKQENAKLLGKIYELEKKIQHYDKKAA
jgi:peptidoglycan hydrolase CwlO-like protein